MILSTESTFFEEVQEIEPCPHLQHLKHNKGDLEKFHTLNSG